MEIPLSGNRLALFRTDYSERMMDHLKLRKGQVRPDKPHKVTKITITVKQGESVLGEVFGESFCHPNDTINRAQGRKMALMRAFDQDPKHGILTKSDRQLIVQKILHFNTESRRKKKSSNPESEETPWIPTS